jgi:hypothetical protein
VVRCITMNSFELIRIRCTVWPYYWRSPCPWWCIRRVKEDIQVCASLWGRHKQIILYGATSRWSSKYVYTHSRNTSAARRRRYSTSCHASTSSVRQSKVRYIRRSYTFFCPSFYGMSNLPELSNLVMVTIFYLRDCSLCINIMLLIGASDCSYSLILL